MLMNYKNVEVYYEDHGSGETVVLIHGFLENSSMWTYLITQLKSTNRVVCIDLLGHGKTGNLGYIHTMEEMAKSVMEVLKQLKISAYSLIGHSMGGYVALSIAKYDPKAIRGICLMNSTYRADTKERKLIREKAIEMVRRNYELVVRSSFLNLFATESKTKFKEEIELALNEALQTSVQGYVAAQRGMMERQDHFEFFKTLNTEKLIIIGAKDPIMDGDRIIKETSGTTINCEELSLGHMSHIENKSENTYFILQFIENIYS